MIENQLYRFSASHILAMLHDVLEDYRDLRNRRLKVYAFEITKSYTIQIHEAKIELLADLLGQSFEKIKKNYQLPENADYKLSGEEAYELLTQLIVERQKSAFLIKNGHENCEDLRINDYKITAKIILLNYILDVGYYDINANSIHVSTKKMTVLEAV